MLDFKTSQPTCDMTANEQHFIYCKMWNWISHTMIVLNRYASKDIATDLVS